MDNTKLIGLLILFGIAAFAWSRRAQAYAAPGAAAQPPAPQPWFAPSAEPWITPVDVPMPWTTPIDQPAPTTPAAFDFENPIPQLPAR